MLKNYNFHLKCENCGLEFNANEPINTCTKCGNLLNVVYDNFEKLDSSAIMRENNINSMWRYLELLPHPIDSNNIVSLGEGSGGLLSLKKLSEKTGLDIYARYYGTNPTGTHKDLGMSVAFSMAKEIGIYNAITYSTGNAGTSLSAYASRAGMTAFIISRATISEEKLTNILTLGGKTLLVKDLEDPWKFLDELSKVTKVYYFTNFLNPFRAEGHKTFAYDIFRTLGDTTYTVYEPLGTGGGIWGTWRGFNDLKNLGLVNKIPRIVGVQPEAVKHAVVAFQKGLNEASPFGDSKNTQILSLADSIPLFGDRRPLAAVKGSGGEVLACSDEETRDAMLMLGKEGLFVEPASATSLVGLLKEFNDGKVDKNEVIVLSLTGTGLKQPSFIESTVEKNVIRMEKPDVTAIASIIQGDLQ